MQTSRRPPNPKICFMLRLYFEVTVQVLLETWNLKLPVCEPSTDHTGGQCAIQISGPARIPGPRSLPTRGFCQLGQKPLTARQSCDRSAELLIGPHPSPCPVPINVWPPSRLLPVFSFSSSYLPSREML